MRLYRHHASPIYSPVEVTENERPVLAGDVAAMFTRAGFDVSSHYLSGLAYRYVAWTPARLALPIYAVIGAALFGLPLMRRQRPFVLSVGEKVDRWPSSTSSRSATRAAHRDHARSLGARSEDDGARADLL
jgi:hypothetical protein